MEKSLLRSLWFTLVVCLAPCLVHAESEDAFLPISQIFAALSRFDHDAMCETVTDDFVLLEHGEVWDMDRLIEAVKPGNYQRKNYIGLISKSVSGDMALINYWNKAAITEGDQSVERAWLESAVVVKEDGQWKIEQMHSTRIDADKVPESVAFKEM